MFAECLNRVAAFKECLTFCDKRLTERPDRIGLQRVRAETLVDAYVIGKEKDGVRIVEKSSLEFFTKIVTDEKHRTTSDLHYLARLKEWTGDVNGAFELINRAEELESKHWANSFNRAVFYWHIGDSISAVRHGQRACALAPWRPQPWRLVGTIQDSRGEKREAQSSRDRAEEVEQSRVRAARDAVAEII
jgi:Flp pilus assembly protein TadD